MEKQELDYESDHIEHLRGMTKKFNKGVNQKAYIKMIKMKIEPKRKRILMNQDAKHYNEA